MVTRTRKNETATPATPRPRAPRASRKTGTAPVAETPKVETPKVEIASATKVVNADRARKLATPVVTYRAAPGGTPDGEKGTPMRRVGSLRARGHGWNWTREVRDGVRGWSATCGGTFGKQNVAGCGANEGWFATEYESRDGHQAHLAALRAAGTAEVTEKS